MERGLNGVTPEFQKDIETQYSPQLNCSCKLKKRIVSNIGAT